MGAAFLAVVLSVFILVALEWVNGSGPSFRSVPIDVAEEPLEPTRSSVRTPQARPASTSPEEHLSSKTWLKRKNMQPVLENASDQPLLFLLGVGVDSASPLVDRMARELGALGIQIAGQPGDTSESSIEWIAQARRAVELGEPSDPVARERVQHFLEVQTGELSGVVWFTPGSRQDEVNHYLLLANH